VIAPVLTAATAAAAALLAAAPQADRTLSPEDLEDARIAWLYFERNYQPRTGFVSSVEGYPATSLWDLGSSLLATIAAEELGLLDAEVFDNRVSALLRTLSVQRLFQGQLPNKVYDAATGVMTDYQRLPSERGIGWSALDLGRFVSALLVLAQLHPEHRPAISAVLRHWRLCELASGGELRGAVIDPEGHVQLVQEGRLGYEQYAARALARLGLDLDHARRYDRFAVEETILGVRVRRDARDPRTYGAQDVLATEPWVLGTIELGLDDGSAPLVRSLFDVQKRRWETTGIVTAATEDHVDRPPWFVYGAVWANGAAWRTITPEGEDVARLSMLSTKAAFALAELYPDDPYARVLRDAIAGARDPERGWYAGVYERGGIVNRALTANTNGVILESLLWKSRGTLLGPERDPAGGEPLVTVSCPPAPVTTTATASSAPDPVPFSSVPGFAPRNPAASLQPGRRSWMRLDGTLFTGYRGADRGTAGVLATLWPIGFAFLRIGGEFTPFSPYQTSRLLWGIGYDDWHDRTFFFHVENWGPVRPNDVRDTRQAQVVGGYKLPRLCVGRATLCAAPVASVVTPFNGGPYLDGRMTVTLKGAWFVVGGIGWTVPGVYQGPAGTPRWRVVYGFGYANWRPGSLFITYHDWGPDSRSGNGILAVGVNWAF
jgi:hypothetical protein